MSDLIEISNKLGSLQAEQISSRRDHERTLQKLDELAEQLAPLASLIKTVDEMKPHVEDWYKMKQRGLGILAVIGLMGGAVGSSLTSFWTVK